MSDSSGKNGKKSIELHTNQPFDYTKGKNISDQQMQYEESVAQQRGITSKAKEEVYQYSQNDKESHNGSDFSKVENGSKTENAVHEREQELYHREPVYAHGTTNLSSNSTTVKNNENGSFESDNREFADKIDDSSMNTQYSSSNGYENQMNNSSFEEKAVSYENNQEDSHGSPKYSLTQNIQESQNEENSRIDENREIPSSIEYQQPADIHKSDNHTDYVPDTIQNSATNNEPYDYTKNRNIQEKQHEYDDQVNQNRGIPSFMKSDESYGIIYDQTEPLETTSGHTPKDNVSDEIKRNNFQEDNKKDEQLSVGKREDSHGDVPGTHIQAEQNKFTGMVSGHQEKDTLKTVGSMEHHLIDDAIENNESSLQNAFNQNIMAQIRQTVLETDNNSALEGSHDHEKISDSLIHRSKEEVSGGYDYTKNIHIQDEQKQYDEDVNQQRGIPVAGHKKDNIKEEDSIPGMKEFMENHQDPISEYASEKIGKTMIKETKEIHQVQTSENMHTDEQLPQDSASENSIPYDYTKSSTVEEKQKVYEDRIEKERVTGIQNPESKNIEDNEDFHEGVYPENTLDNKINEAIQESIHKNVFQKEKSQPPDKEEKIAKLSNSKEGIRKGREGDVQIDKEKGQQKSGKRSRSPVILHPEAGPKVKNNTLDKKVAEEFSKISKKGDSKENRIGLAKKELVDNTEKKTIYVSRINEIRGVSPDQIQNRKIDLSELYEKSARGGEKSSELALTMGASSEDIANLLQTRGLKPTGKIIFKVGDSIQKATNVAGTYIQEVSFGNSDAGQGLRMSKEYLDPVIFAVVDTAMMSMDKAMKKNLAIKLNKLAEKYKVFKDSPTFIANTELGINAKELEALEKELKSKLKAAGHIELKGSGITLQNQIRAYLKKNKGKLTESEVGALKMYLAIAKNKTMDQNIHSRRKIFRHKIVMKSFRYLQQTDAGAGALFTYNLIRNAKITLTLGLKLLMTAAKTAALAGKLALRTSAQLAAKLAKTKLAQKLAQTKAGKAASAGTKVVKNGIGKVKSGRNALIDKAKNSRLAKMKNAFDRKFQKFNQFRKDPFNLKKRRNNLLLQIKRSKFMQPINAVFAPINLVKRALGYITATIMSIVSYIMSVLMVLAAMALLLLLIVVIVSAIISSLFATFDFSANEEEIIEASFEMIKNNYEAHNNMIEGLYNGQYANVTVTYEAVRDDDAYELEEHKLDEPLIETTNSAEMLSMAQVRFDFDLEEAGKSEVVEYIRQLYNGSHMLMVVETPVWGKDKDGNNVIIETNAQATLTTHYFNSLFECKLSDTSGIVGGGTIGAGTTIDVPQNFKQCITVTEYDKWVNEWGVAAGTLQRKISDLWTQQGQPFDNGFAYLTINGQKRYLVALVDTFGKVGDYVDVKFANGTILPAIIADAKSRNDSNITEWGHITGNAISVLEVEVQSSVFRQKGNPGTPKWWPELDSNVTQIVNGGSYFANPNGPVKFPPGKGVLGNPCPGARISSEFGPRPSPGGIGSTNHKGRDYAAAAGTPVLAAQSGIVKTAKFNSARGYYVVIDHGNGMETWYQHFNKPAIVSVGQTVTKGQQIGSVGMTGNSTGNHLHFEVHINGEAVDPRTYL